MSLITRYEFKDRKLKLKNNKKEKIIFFDFPITQVIEYSNCYVVLLEPNVGHIFNENVYGVSKEGDIVWQVEPIPHIYKDSPYTGMERIENLVKLANWDGTDLFINPSTGKIVRKSFSK